RCLASWKERLAALEVSNVLARLLEGFRLSSLRQGVLRNFRFLRGADTPAKAEDEIASDPGGDEQSRGRGGQKSEAAFRIARRTDQGDEAGGVDHTVDGGGRPGRMLTRNRE